MRRIFLAAGLFRDMFEHLLRFFGWTHYGGSSIGIGAIVSIAHHSLLRSIYLGCAIERLIA
jgi:hypothetical protein